MAISKMQLLQMAQQLRKQGNKSETEALERLAETGLTQEQQTKLQEVMRDKAKMQELMSSPKAQALMKRLSQAKGQEAGE